MKYLLDTNVFIEGKHRYYAFDLCPGFWEWLEQANAAGTVASVAAVADEMTARGDELSTWTHARGASFFLPPDETTLPAFERVAAWVTAQGYQRGEIDLFLEAADFPLVAQASALGCTVVTHETMGSGGRVKIPNVCVGVGVKWVNPWTMLRLEHARFVLDRQRHGAPAA